MGTALALDAKRDGHGEGKTQMDMVEKTGGLGGGFKHF